MSDTTPCPNCGQPVEQSAGHCPNCGATLHAQYPRYGPKRLTRSQRVARGFLVFGAILFGILGMCGAFAAGQSWPPTSNSDQNGVGLFGLVWAIVFSALTAWMMWLWARKGRE